MAKHGMHLQIKIQAAGMPRPCSGTANPRALQGSGFKTVSRSWAKGTLQGSGAAEQETAMHPLTEVQGLVCTAAARYSKKLPQLQPNLSHRSQAELSQEPRDCIPHAHSWTHTYYCWDSGKLVAYCTEYQAIKAQHFVKQESVAPGLWRPGIMLPVIDMQRHLWPQQSWHDGTRLHSHNGGRPNLGSGLTASCHADDQQ